MKWQYHMSRFLFGFSHADHPLHRAQRAAYDQRVQELSRGDRWGWAIAMLPGALALGLIPVWIAIQKSRPLPWSLAAQIIFALMMGVWAVWMTRWRHRRHGPRALRELGLADVCPHCAYDLSRQGEPEGRCPECGAMFTRFLPGKTGSTSPQ